MLMNTTYKKLYKYKNQNILFPRKRYKLSPQQFQLKTKNDNLLVFSIYPAIAQNIMSRVAIFYDTICLEFPHLIIKSKEEFEIYTEINNFRKKFNTITLIYLDIEKEKCLDVNAKIHNLEIFGNVPETIATKLNFLNSLSNILNYNESNFSIRITNSIFGRWETDFRAHIRINDYSKLFNDSNSNFYLKFLEESRIEIADKELEIFLIARDITHTYSLDLFQIFRISNDSNFYTISISSKKEGIEFSTYKSEFYYSFFIKKENINTTDLTSYLNKMFTFINDINFYDQITARLNKIISVEHHFDFSEIEYIKSKIQLIAPELLELDNKLKLLNL